MMSNIILKYSIWYPFKRNLIYCCNNKFQVLNYPNKYKCMFSPQHLSMYYSSNPPKKPPPPHPREIMKDASERYAITVLENRQPPKDRPPYKIPVDWLPFEWHRRSRFKILEESGDIEIMPDVDLNLPKPDFELSEELKSANEQVKSIFSLKTASVYELSQAECDLLVKQVQRHPLDFTSLEVLIVRFTVKIRYLFRAKAQVSEVPKRYSRRYRIQLFHAIQKRNQFLKILYKNDREKFYWLTKLLNVTYVPKPSQLPLIRYTKKWDLRRMTKEYCENIKNTKFTTYHEELKLLQEEFLREKEETLAWIAKEEKELGVYKAEKESSESIQ